MRVYLIKTFLSIASLLLVVSCHIESGSTVAEEPLSEPLIKEVKPEDSVELSALSLKIPAQFSGQLAASPAGEFLTLRDKDERTLVFINILPNFNPANDEELTHHLVSLESDRIFNVEVKTTLKPFFPDSLLLPPGGATPFRNILFSRRIAVSDDPQQAPAQFDIVESHYYRKDQVVQIALVSTERLTSDIMFEAAQVLLKTIQSLQIR